ncbi:MAG TPA: hypothetical protein VJV39_27825 [Dongiaceae bacterium]|nr:hypothetical protein [Dongiaceae bacterium]
MKRKSIGVLLAAALLGCAATEPDATARQPVALSAEAGGVVQDYLARVHGRFGALAVTSDGQRAIYHFCQSRLWKNCDDYELADRFVSIPSGQLAAKEAMARCGGTCVLLYVNEKQQQAYAVATP